MSERTEFQTGYTLGIRHTIKCLETQIRYGVPIEKLADELRRFFASDLKKQNMQVTASGGVSPENAQT
jgi:hypothetical protein